MKGRNMRKVSSKPAKDELRPEYDLRALKGGVKGKYYRQAQAGTNLVLVDPDLAEIFPDADSVNRALRALRDAAKLTAKPSRRVTGGSVRRKHSAA